MSNTATIYALRDPRTNELRYIGKTVKPLNDRRACHLFDAANPRFNSHRVQWLRSLPEPPVVEALMVVGVDMGDAAEIYAIALYRSLGFSLVNSTTGGNAGLRTTPVSEEHRRKIGAAKKGNKFWLGRKHRSDSKEKIRQSILSRTHCSHGHELTAGNTYVYRSGRQAGWRKCRACHRKNGRADNNAGG